MTLESRSSKLLSPVWTIDILEDNFLINRRRIIAHSSIAYVSYIIEKFSTLSVSLFGLLLRFCSLLHGPSLFLQNLYGSR